jgi:hypothetical protein
VPASELGGEGRCEEPPRRKPPAQPDGGASANRCLPPLRRTCFAPSGLPLMRPGNTHDHHAAVHPIEHDVFASLLGAGRQLQLPRSVDATDRLPRAFRANHCSSKSLILLEATPGIEPGYTVLQAASSAAIGGFPQGLLSLVVSVIGDDLLRERR